MEIFKGTPKFWKQFKELQLLSMRTDPLAFLTSYAEASEYSSSDWKEAVEGYLLLQVDGKLKGMLGFGLGGMAKTKHIMHIYGVYLDPELRGRGLATKLLKEALKEIRKTRATKVDLHVCAKQEAAIRLYEKFGFLVTGKLSREFRMNNRYYDVYYMEKIL